ncbi:recombinase family protein [Actinomycetospora endophytica]|uniref:Recombinase family protein n=1 Tax=Actinomycetospora endophytica TaxID=2291215 RepID=A0ABS8P5E6_9PSEU|nr:recombinase family protein [Actinomycetospora endophytica]MCD2193480.1 recombinase family protein [Actinomycetospora endophytica]
MPADKLTRAAIYCRISQDRIGAGLGVERQREECQELAERLGWTVSGVYVDNDISAFSGKRRPQYDRLLADIREGRVDAVIAWHTDRLHRSPIELETYISASERHGTLTHTVRAGSLDLNTPSGRMVARMLGAAARQESEHKGERIAAARAQAAREGRWQGGIRPFGFEADGVTLRPQEAAEIRRAADSILAGGSLRGVVLDLNGRGVLTSTGRTWHSRTLKSMLIRPRNSAQLVYHGEVTGQAPWREIISPDERLRIQQLLADPARRTSTGNQVKWLLSGLAFCGVCGSQRIVCNTSGGSRPGQYRPPAYRCGARELVKRSNHLVRHQPNVDKLVTETVLARLEREDARELITTTDAAVDTAAITAEIETIRERRTSLAEMAADGLMSPAEYRVALTRMSERTSELEAQLLSVPTSSPLAVLVNAEDVHEVWEGLDLGRKRAVIDALMTVTLMPSKNRGPVFDAESVDITWKM